MTGLVRTQVVRYALVGIANNAIGYAAYLLLTFLGTTPKATMTALYMIGVAVGFVGHRRYTFGHRGGALGSGLRYLAAYAAGYVLNFLLLAVFVDRLAYPHQLVQGVALFIVAGFLFVVLRYLVFPAGTGSSAR